MQRFRGEHPFADEALYELSGQRTEYAHPALRAAAVGRKLLRRVQAGLAHEAVGDGTHVLRKRHGINLGTMDQARNPHWVLWLFCLNKGKALGVAGRSREPVDKLHCIFRSNGHIVIPRESPSKKQTE